ncbi:MAG TPA: serine hydrolase [Candidatus Paceibacterota bacterium]|jgi:D-alanyl-D-alanine carboxypeptidase|nr:serine hydrolase [Candidatus Paceibacterota bacterium]HRS48052.1 serine hydrolase [Candidatus Paceibacterota bacterium]
MNKFRQPIFIIFLLGLVIFLSFKNSQTFSLNKTNYPEETSVATADNSANLENKVYPIITYLNFFNNNPKPSSLPTPTPSPLEPDLKAQAAVLVDLSNNDFIYKKNINDKMLIASLTKLMTVLVAYENVENLNQTFVIQQEDLNIESHHPNLAIGDRFNFQEMLYMILITSDNSITHALARSLEVNKIINFTDLMNQKAQQLGMVNTYFEEETGLNDNYSTITDLIILTKEILNKYPQIFSYSVYPSLTIKNIDGKVFNLTNTNPIIKNIPSIIGSKTGYTEKSLGNLLVVFKNQDKIILAIVLKSPDRTTDMLNLISYYLRITK